MSAEAKAKEAIAEIDRVMSLLDDHQFDTVWYLLSIAKLSLLVIAGPDDGGSVDHHLPSLISPTDPDFATILSKKH